MRPGPLMLRDDSTFGCGVRSQVRLDEETGAIDVTRWITLASAPVLPLSRWKAEYAGSVFPEVLLDPSVRFRATERLPLEFVPIQATYLRGYAILLAAVLPAASMIIRTEGRAATAWEFLLVILSTLWPSAIMIYVLILPGRRLRTRAPRFEGHALHGAGPGWQRWTEND